MFGVLTATKKLIEKLKWHSYQYKIYFNRNKIIEDYLKSHKIKKLQLGCWPFPLDSWLNSDLHAADKVIPIDITNPFPIKDVSFHYVFCEHTIEHFSFAQGEIILREIYRVLKPKGKVRLATPDLKFLIDLYKDKKSSLQQEYINWASGEFLKEWGKATDTFIINNFVRAWGHQFIYDFKTLKFLLERVRFVNVKRYTPGQSQDPNLKGLESHSKSIGEQFNRLETFVVEAVKP